MLEFVIQKKAALMLGVLLAAMGFLMSRSIHRTGSATPLEAAVGRATAPLVQGGSRAAGSVSRRWSSFSELRGSADRARALQAEVETLRADKRRFERERAENARLLRLVDLKASLPESTIAARIAAASPLEDRTILLDRGRAGGLRAGLPVVTAAGVLGKTIEVTESLAKVLLVTDPASGVAVAQQDGHYAGMMVGRGRRSCQLLYVPTDRLAVAGDLLVTTGLDDLFPPGLPAGRVLSVRRAPDGSMEVDVRPEALAQDDSEVLVVLSAPALRLGP